MQRRAAAVLAMIVAGFGVGCATQGTVTTYEDGRPTTTVLTPSTERSVEFGQATYVEANGRAVGVRSREGVRPFGGAVEGFDRSQGGYTHRSTGLTLPPSHAACVLVDLRRAVGGRTFAPGFSAEYACPAPDLSHVALFIVEARDRPTSVEAACNLAVALSQRDSLTPVGLQCLRMTLQDPNVPHAGLLSVQAGGRWSNPRIAPRTNGSATILHAGENGAVAFTNTCIDTQCANRPAFGAFVDGFDLCELARVQPQ